MVRLPAAQELGGEDLAEKRPGVPDGAHLDVPLLQQLVPHAVAVQRGPAAGSGAHFGAPLGPGYVGGSRPLALLLLLLLLPAVAAAPAGAAAAIHGQRGVAAPGPAEAGGWGEKERDPRRRRGQGIK